MYCTTESFWTGTLRDSSSFWMCFLVFNSSYTDWERRIVGFRPCVSAESLPAHLIYPGIHWKTPLKGKSGEWWEMSVELNLCALLSIAWCVQHLERFWCEKIEINKRWRVGCCIQWRRRVGACRLFSTRERHVFMLSCLIVSQLLSHLFWCWTVGRL